MKNHNKLLLALISVVMFLLLTTIGSIAQTTNDPNGDAEANACYEGGTLYTTCNSTDADHDGDIDQQDSDWMWRCGYYLIRVEHGIYSSDVLDGVCMEIIEAVEVEVTKKKKKKVVSCASLGRSVRC